MHASSTAEFPCCYYNNLSAHTPQACWGAIAENFQREQGLIQGGGWGG